MIGQQNNNINLSQSFNLEYETENYNQNNYNNNYIEIADDIKTFDALIKSENFAQIKAQYIYYINQLGDLYSNFRKVKTDSQSIIKLIEDEKHYYQFKDLFYSYATVRKSIYEIINYLTSNKNDANEYISTIIYVKLIDCFEICLSGFNSKILRIHDYMLFSCNLNLTDNINTKIRNILDDTINDLLIEQQKTNTETPLAFNIHSQNAIFNLVANSFNFYSIVDRYANISYISNHAIDKIIRKIYISLSKLNICRLIVDILYDLFQNILTKTGKSHWVDNYITDYKEETVNDIEEYFLNELNKYLGLSNINSQIKIQDIITLNEDTNELYIGDIKNKLHYLVALYIDNSPNALAGFCYNCETLISIGNDLTLFSISRGYFYILNSNQEQITLQLDHIEKIRISDLPIDVYIPVLIQALHQTFTTKKIYQFFYNPNISNLFFNSKYSKYIIKALTNEINNDTNLKNKISMALCEPHIQQGFIVAEDIFLQLINNTFLADCIITNLLTNNINICNSIEVLNYSEFYNIINNLDSSSLNKLVTNKYNKKIVSKFKNIFYSLFKNNNWGLIIKLLNSKLKFELVTYLTIPQKIKALKIVLYYKIDKIIKFFLLDYVQLQITDRNKNNIFHYLFTKKDTSTLIEITKTTDVSLINQLIVEQNNVGVTALKIAENLPDISYFNILYSKFINKNLKAVDSLGNSILMSIINNNNKNTFDLIFDDCNIDIINIKNKNDDTAVILASKVGNIYFLQKIIEKYNTSILLEVNKQGNNSLMIAIENGNDDCVEYLLNKHDYSWLNHKNKQKTNALLLAIRHNSLHLEKIIKKVNIDIINAKDKDGYNSIIMASKYNLNDNIIDSLLRHNNKIDLFERTYFGYSAAMLAAATGNLSCLKKIFEYSNQDIFLQINFKSYNSLMLAIKNKQDDCVEFILDNSAINIIKLQDLNKKNALYLAIELNSIHAKTIIDKADESIILATSTNHYNSIMLATNLGYSEILKKLLEKLDDSKALLKKTYYSRYNAVMLATQNGYLACIKILVNFTGIKILESSNGQDYNSLMLAIEHQHNDCVNFLLENSNDKILSQKSFSKENCLHLAIKNNSIYIKAIIEKSNSSIIKAADANYMTSLMLAAKHEDIEITDLLLKKYSDNILDRGGFNNENAIMIAARHNNSACIALLLKNCKTKIHLHLTNKLNETVITIAIKCENLNCLKTLIQYLLKQEHLKHNNINHLANSIFTAYIYERIDCLEYLIESCNKKILTKVFSNIHNHGYNLLKIAEKKYKTACDYEKNDKNTTILENKTRIMHIFKNAYERIYTINLKV